MTDLAPIYFILDELLIIVPIRFKPAFLRSLANGANKKAFVVRAISISGFSAYIFDIKSTIWLLFLEYQVQ